ncbi:hypothetical protein ACQY0O_008011 [Thecaphora frezii]
MASGSESVQAPSAFGHHITGLAQQDLSLYTSSRASSSSSSLVDPSSDRSSSLSGGHGNSFSPRATPFGSGSESQSRTDRSGPGPSSSSQGFTCPNCGKAFARDDLLRRHLAREARALAQPSFDRQKSCYECARSKARCDLEVPSCGRCRSRGKHCAYAPRSGNPNVRKARNAGMMPAVAGGSVRDHGHLTSMSPMDVAMAPNFGAEGTGVEQWAIQSTGYGAGGSGFVKREGEADYDSTSDSEFGRSWNESYGEQFRLARTSSISSGSVCSSKGSPRRPFSFSEVPGSAPPSVAQFGVSSDMPPGFATPIRTESPHSYSDVPLGPATAMGPIHGGPRSRSSGFARTNTGSIVTNIDRQGATFTNEEGEETPIVRVTNHFAQATGLDPRNPHVPVDGHALATPSARQRTASLPQADHEPSMGDSEMSAPWDARQVGPANLSGNVVRSGPQGSTSMMPPPQPPTLITSNLNRNHMVFPSPIRPSLFTNGLDLSGWLEEPVVPSPLCRAGPGMQAFQYVFPSHGMGGMLSSPIVETPISARFAASLAQLMGSHPAPSSDTAAANSNTANGSDGSRANALSGGTASMMTPSSDPSGVVRCSGPAQLDPAQRDARFGQDASSPQQPQLPSAKQCWIVAEQSGEVKASLAQLSAAYFVSFPSFLVLSDPTAPCPPKMHRKWLQELRNRHLVFLANARSVLAGYFVRLPASESFVWKLIAEQILAIIADSTRLCGYGASEDEIISAIASLWMYLVLLIFTDDAACTQHVDEILLNNGLCALSELSQSLSSKLQAALLNESDSGPSALSANLTTFSQTETAIRIVYAAYSLLVLQRFREDGQALRSKLAGCEMILDIPLPASAAEFEAANEGDWRAGQARAAEALGVAGSPAARPTLRSLLVARKETDAAASKQTGSAGDASSRPRAAWTDVYFDSHDTFTNVVLSIALALDADRI